MNENALKVLKYIVDDGLSHTQQRAGQSGEDKPSNRGQSCLGHHNLVQSILVKLPRFNRPNLDNYQSFRF